MEVALSISGLYVNQEEINSTERKQLVVDVNLQLRISRPLTLIGESGCGKSLVGQAVIGLIPRGVEARGEIMYQGVNLQKCGRKHLRSLWGRELFLFPQEPKRYLNPLVRSFSQVVEVYRRIYAQTERKARHSARQMLSLLDLDVADGRKYPWQLSGGMGQRVLTAISLAEPARVIVADEPTKGLDEQSRNEAISLLRSLSESDKALLVISHDMEIPAQLGGDIAVMYGGRILEIGPAAEILAKPRHPYTIALHNALPKNGLHPIPRKANCHDRREGGCIFLERCPEATSRCISHPLLRPVGSSGCHQLACHHHE